MADRLPNTRRVSVLTALREKRVWRIQFGKVFENSVQESLEIHFKRAWRIQFGRVFENSLQESLENSAQYSFESLRKESLERKSEELTVDRRV